MTLHRSIEYPPTGQIRVHIDQMRSHGVSITTTDVLIKRFFGQFRSERGVPAKNSRNAQFGRYISQLAGQLGLRKGRRVTVDGGDGRKTTAHQWLL